METKNEKKQDNGHGNNGKGPKYFIDFEGVQLPWNQDSITYEQLILLAEVSANDGIIEIDMQEGTETTLKPGEIIQLKPGQGFSKKVKFKRGYEPAN